MANAEYPVSDVSQSINVEVPLEDVLRLQAFAMGEVRDVARTRVSKHDPRVNMFGILHQTQPCVATPANLIQKPNDLGEYADDIEIDTYLGVVVRKPSPRQWRLTVSFLQYSLTEYSRASNHRELFQFEWKRKSETAVAGHRTIVTLGRVAATHSIVKDNMAQFGETVQYTRATRRQLVSSTICKELIERMREHSSLYVVERFERMMAA